MKPKFIFTIGFLFLIVNDGLFCQTIEWEWARSINGPSNEDEIDAVASDNKGNVYISGKFQDSISYSGSTTPMVSAGMADIMLIKYDSLGNLLWEKQFGGIGEDNAFDAACDQNNNLFISGYFQETIQFDTITLTSFGGFDFFLIKLNENGNVLWAKQFGGTGNEGGNEIAIDNAGRIVVSADSDGQFHADGHIFSNLGYNDSYIMLLSQNGTLNWIRAIEGTGTIRGKAVAVDDNGNVYFGGDYLGPNRVVDENETTHSFNLVANREAFLTAWTANGDLKWLKNWGGSGDDLCKGVATNQLGEVFVMGPFQDEVNLDGNIINSVPEVNFYVWKLDSDGNTIWTRHLASPSEILTGGEILSDGRNGVILGVGMTDTLQLQTSTISKELLLPFPAVSPVAYPVFINYTREGDVAYSKISDYSDYGTFGEISRSGNIVYLDAPFAGTCVFANDTVTAGSYTNKDAAIVCIKLPDNELGIASESIGEKVNFTVYPNPATSILYIDVIRSNPFISEKIFITDITGRRLQREDCKQHNVLNIETLHAGIYFIQIGKHSLPFIKQ
jgi:hypothetical protein